MSAKRKPGSDPLRTYRAKRSLDRTPEPGAHPATAAPSAGGLFVVHMHAARRLHWDLRLEMEDRKSTRLNSSHGYISYAVFCLKKKNTDILTIPSPHATILT